MKNKKTITAGLAGILLGGGMLYNINNQDSNHLYCQDEEQTVSVKGFEGDSESMIV